MFLLVANVPGNCAVAPGQIIFYSTLPVLPSPLKAYVQRMNVFKTNAITSGAIPTAMVAIG